MDVSSMAYVIFYPESLIHLKFKKYLDIASVMLYIVIVSNAHATLGTHSKQNKGEHYNG